jgi:hypothetical protein
MLFEVFKSVRHGDRQGSLRSSVSREAKGKSERTFVDTALARDEISQRFIQVLEFCRVPQYPRPLAPRSIIDLVTISRAKNHRWLKPSANTA